MRSERKCSSDTGVRGMDMGLGMGKQIGKQRRGAGGGGGAEEGALACAPRFKNPHHGHSD